MLGLKPKQDDQVTVNDTVTDTVSDTSSEPTDGTVSP